MRTKELKANGSCCYLFFLFGKSLTLVRIAEIGIFYLKYEHFASTDAHTTKLYALQSTSSFSSYEVNIWHHNRSG